MNELCQSWSKDGFPMNLMKFHLKQPGNALIFWNLQLQDELSGNGSGTVVFRSPKGSRSSALHDQSSQVVFKLSSSDMKLLLYLCCHLLRILMQCSLAAVMLLLKMLLQVELLFYVASMMILILHRHWGPDRDFMTEIQMPHWKIVLQI